MTSLSLFTAPANTGEVQTMSTREIAELTGKQHKDVLYDTRKMIEDLGLTLADFSADLPDAYGRLQPVFLLPKRETLILVSGYNTELRARIIDRWQELESGKAHPVVARQQDPAARAVLLAGLVSDALNLHGSARLGTVQRAIELTAPELASIVPAYAIDAPSTHITSGSWPTASATELLKKHGVTIGVAKFNQLLADAGIIEQLTRPSANKGQKAFWSITPAGERYGKNVTSPRNQRETQPHWYVAQFGALLKLVRDMY